MNIYADCATVQDDWWLCMVTKKSCTKLKMSEFDDKLTFSDERATPEVKFFISSKRYGTYYVCKKVCELSVPHDTKHYVNTFNREIK